VVRTDERTAGPVSEAAPGGGGRLPGAEGPTTDPVRARIIEVALVVPVLALLGVGVWQQRDELVLGVWFFAACVAVVDLIPVPTWGGLQLSLSFPVLLGAAMVYPPAIAGLIGAIGSFDPREIRREIPILQSLWNRCQIAVSTAAAAATFGAIATVESSWTRIVPGILLAAVVGYTLNALFVAAYIAFRQRMSLGRVIARMHGGAPYEFLLSYLGLGLMGAVIAVFYEREGAWSVVVLLAPLVFARQMYFRSRGLADRLAAQNATLADQASKLEELLEKEHHTVGELRELNRMKGEFVAVVSHELRTPVTALIGYAKTLQQPGFADDAELRKEFLERMERQGDRLLRLVENLLTVSRIESRQLPISVGRVLFEDLVQEVVEGLSNEAERVRVDVPDDLPILYTDRGLLGRVLSNLIDNALKYSPEGTACEVGARPDGDGIVFWVRDHGIGIASDELPRIFERFYQIDSSSTRTFRGAGLGLSLVQDLLMHLGGTIEVASEPSRGSTFTVRMPARTAQAPAVAAIPSELRSS
jgi:signal transduction histidine kinase